MRHPTEAGCLHNGAFAGNAGLNEAEQQEDLQQTPY